VLRFKADGVGELFGVTLGRGTRFMMASRPETEMTAAVALMPAFCTHSLTASLTSPAP